MDSIQFQKSLFGFKKSQVMEYIASLQREQQAQYNALAAQMEERLHHQEESAKRERDDLLRRAQAQKEQYAEALETLEKAAKDLALQCRQAQESAKETRAQLEARLQAVQKEHDDALQQAGHLNLKNDLLTQQVQALQTSYDDLTLRHEELRKQSEEAASLASRERDTLNHYIDVIYAKNKQLEQHNTQLEDKLFALQRETSCSSFPAQAAGRPEREEKAQGQDAASASANATLELIRSEIMNAIDLMMRRIEGVCASSSEPSGEEKPTPPSNGVVFKLADPK